MMASKQAFLKDEKCKKCNPCEGMKACPSGALQEEEGFLFVGAGCQGCGSCLKACPYKAIEIR